MEQLHKMKDEVPDDLILGCGHSVDWNYEWISIGADCDEIVNPCCDDCIEEAYNKLKIKRGR